MLTLENSTPTPLERDLIEHKAGEPDRTLLDPVWRRLFPEECVTWPQILDLGNASGPLQPILFTAPSGSGKSTELHFLGVQLRKEGKAVLAVEARHLAAGELENRLDAEELADWQKWKSGVVGERSPLYLLLDAVDELYLSSRNLQDLRAALRRNELLGPKVRLVVSSRDDTWGPRETQWFCLVNSDLQSQFSTNRAAFSDVSDQRRIDDESDDLARQPVVLAVEQDKPPGSSDFRHIKLAFLTPQQVLALSPHSGLAQAEKEEFLATLNAAEIGGLFPFRPRDVKTLVGYWQAHRNFDSWSDVLGWQVRNAFQEFNPQRGRHEALSLERYAAGIRRIAAVITFSDVRHVLRPDSITVKGAPHAEDLFPEWKPGELKELFASPLLVRKGPASSDDSGIAVQIVQGQLSDYLAAQWASGVYLGGAEDAILKSLFVVPTEHDVESVPADRRGVAGWLAGILPQVRKRLLDVAPEVVLYFGDPTRLSDDEVCRTLVAILQNPPVGSHEYGTNARLSRIARPELSTLVVGALTDQTLPSRLARELLQVARQGAFQPSVEPALDWAMNEEAEEYTRKRAVELVADLGRDEQKQKLLALTGTDSPPVRVALFRALVPEYLSGEKLVEFLARENAGSIVSEVHKQPLPLSSQEHCRLAELLGSRLRTASREGAPDSLCNGAEDGTARLALQVVKLRASDPQPLEPEFSELAILLQSRKLHIYVDKGQEALIRTGLCENHWERIWEARLRHEPLWDQQMMLCPIVSQRFDWVMEKLALLESGDVHGQLWMWSQEFLNSLTENDLAHLKTISSPTALAFVERWQELSANQRDAIRQNESERELEKIKQRDKNDAVFRPHLAKIRRGEHQRALYRSYPYFPESSFSRPSELHEFVSLDVADALSEGFQNWWRNSSPEVNSTQTTYGESWGLLGISLEISAKGLRGIQSDEEVRVATLLALRELNSVPDWLTKLHADRPRIVEDTLRQVLVEAWGSKAGRTSFTSHLYRLDAPALINAVAEMLFTLLGKVVPESAGTLDDAIDLILRTSAPPEWLPRVAAEWTKNATDAEFRKQWLRLWCHSDGGPAAQWLVDERKNDSSWDQVIREVCQKVVWDLDRGNPGKRSVFLSTESLRCWLPLMVALSPPEKKFRRPGRRRIAQAWTLMDHSREVLDACETHLVADGSVSGTAALKALSNHPDVRVSAWAQKMLPFQRSNAVKLAQEVWDVEKILEAERFARRVPLTTAELCDVVLGELRRIDNRMREGDFAYPEFFTSKLHENDIQRWVASQLELVGKRTFYVGRESEVKDGNKMDIVAIRPSLGRVPIEIKPIFRRTNYSISDLEKTIDDQVVGKYMRPGEVSHGILLLVRLVSKQWGLDGERVDFVTGVEHLKSYAKRHAKFGNTVAVAVIDIEGARGPRKNLAGETAKARRS